MEYIVLKFDFVLRCVPFSGILFYVSKYIWWFDLVLFDLLSWYVNAIIFIVFLKLK